MLQQKLDTALVQAEKKIYALQKHNSHSFTTYACDDNAPQNEFILAILNNHEFATSGIKEGAFDEGSYKRMLCSVVIKDWFALKAYIFELRSKRNHPTLFQEFEWLAERWAKKPLDKIKK